MPVPVVLDDQVVLVAVVDRTASLTASVGVLLRVPRGGASGGNTLLQKGHACACCNAQRCDCNAPDKRLVSGGGRAMNSNAAAPTVIAAETSGPRQTSTPTDPIPSGLQYITL